MIEVVNPPTKLISQDELNDTDFPCWKCSCLKIDTENHQFVCRYGKILFSSTEPIFGKDDLDCENIRDDKRKAINGKTTILLRLLSIHDKIMLSSLPEELKGCVGNLKRYNLCKVNVGKTKVSSSDHPERQDLSLKIKIVELNLPW